MQVSDGDGESSRRRKSMEGIDTGLDWPAGKRERKIQAARRKLPVCERTPPRDGDVQVHPPARLRLTARQNGLGFFLREQELLLTKKSLLNRDARSVAAARLECA
jgi:hypothetical protein